MCSNPYHNSLNEAKAACQQLGWPSRGQIANYNILPTPHVAIDMFSNTQMLIHSIIMHYTLMVMAFWMALLALVLNKISLIAITLNMEIINVGIMQVYAVQVILACAYTLRDCFYTTKFLWCIVSQLQHVCLALFFALLVPQPCNETGAIRLTHQDILMYSSRYYSIRGRLEVCSGDQWGSVCYSDETTNDVATVACRQLNHVARGKN